MSSCSPRRRLGPGCHSCEPIGTSAQSVTIRSATVGLREVLERPEADLRPMVRRAAAVRQQPLEVLAPRPRRVLAGAVAERADDLADLAQPPLPGGSDGE